MNYFLEDRFPRWNMHILVTFFVMDKFSNGIQSPQWFFLLFKFLAQMAKGFEKPKPLWQFGLKSNVM